MISKVEVDNAIHYATNLIKGMDLERINEEKIYLKPLDYYVFGSVYPPLKAMHPIDKNEVYSDASKDASLYVHIPFCEQYCTFCHFAKEINPKQTRVSRYLEALHKEIELVKSRLGEVNVKSLYFGGGTASYLHAEQINNLFLQLKKHFNFTNETEITYELHPGVIRQNDYEDRLLAMKANGVNRWVFGIQSMDDKVLAKLNRGHTGKEAIGLLKLLEKHDCHNVSVDLIFGLPYQTLENWYSTLEDIAATGVAKFNIFPLMLKASDPITIQYIKEPEIFPNAEDRILMHFIADYVLIEKHGYEYGPVFYYTRPDKKFGAPSRQQQSKFEDIECTNLLGLGVSAFGYLGNTHYYNICDMNGYMETLEKDVLPVWQGYSLLLEERMRREIMLSIRSSGVNRSKFIEKYGIDPGKKFKKEFMKLIQLNLVVENLGTYQLTKYGAFHADGIALQFVSDEVNKLCVQKNIEIMKDKPLRNPIERFDYTPIKRVNDEVTKLIQAKYKSE